MGLSHHDLELAGITDLMAIDAGDQVADFQSGFGCGGVGFHLRHDGAAIVLRVEELRVFRRDVSDAEPHVAVADFAIANQRFHRGPHDLRWNRESHA